MRGFENWGVEKEGFVSRGSGLVARDAGGTGWSLVSGR
jgi:hypothetical protein